MQIGTWDDTIHLNPSQQSRMRTAATAPLTPLSLDRENSIGEFSGAHGRYTTSLYSCDCYDFDASRGPCKHIYRLAHELLGFDLGHPVKVSKQAIQYPVYEVVQSHMDSISAIIDGESQADLSGTLRILEAIYKTGRLKVLEASISYIEEKLWLQNPLCFNNAVVTGRMSINREDFMALLEEVGFHVKNSVSKKTCVLISGEDAGSKLEIAHNLGVPVLSETEFLDSIKEHANIVSKYYKDMPSSTHE